MAWGKSIDKPDQGFPTEAPSADAPTDQSIVADPKTAYERDMQPPAPRTPGDRANRDAITNIRLNSRWFQPEATPRERRDVYRRTPRSIDD